MDLETIAVNIIANAGESKSFSLSSVDMAKSGNIATAKELLKQANDALIIAHKEHTSILVNEANHGKLELSFLAVHASNHLSIADISYEFATRMVEMYELFLKKS